MHSQEYTIFDKVNLYQHWIAEFCLKSPTDAEAARHFQISKPQATRLRVISQLDESVGQEMINSDKLPADEVIYEIANRPAPEHRQAYQRYGTLTVGGLRKLLKHEKSSRPDSKAVGKSGRPRNFTFALKDESSPFTFISTARTPNEWKERGGAKAFIAEVMKLMMRHDVREQLKRELA